MERDRQEIIRKKRDEARKEKLRYITVSTKIRDKRIDKKLADMKGERSAREMLEQGGLNKPKSSGGNFKKDKKSEWIIDNE